ncbi:hypothetical protein B296_00018857 [Ensete ventricosum]|uniref:Secreted protein n=1 Tax=Ensete ventricosum TaxID=4639 RepID=A0A426ZK10_ENSVE|nr:hypothetical protein B296_00018857 [Ensete ventricosum]
MGLVLLRQRLLLLVRMCNLVSGTLHQHLGRSPHRCLSENFLDLQERHRRDCSSPSSRRLCDKRGASNGNLRHAP